MTRLIIVIGIGLHCWNQGIDVNSHEAVKPSGYRWMTSHTWTHHTSLPLATTGVHSFMGFLLHHNPILIPKQLKLWLIETCYTFPLLQDPISDENESRWGTVVCPVLTITIVGLLYPDPIDLHWPAGNTSCTSYDDLSQSGLSVTRLLTIILVTIVKNPIADHCTA